MTTDFINGEDIQLHEVMIAGEQARTNLELLMEIRNKAVDMYKELSRM
jgi:flagellar hook-basal body complex protein FliE